MMYVFAFSQLLMHRSLLFESSTPLSFANHRRNMRRAASIIIGAIVFHISTIGDTQVVHMIDFISAVSGARNTGERV